jgi:malonyl CoA-acyl carrier protein transacylase
MTLKIPDGGLLLEGPSGKDPNVPPQAFAITLNDNIIESLIKCVQNGENLELALGKTPVCLVISGIPRALQSWMLSWCSASAMPLAN